MIIAAVDPGDVSGVVVVEIHVDPLRLRVLQHQEVPYPHIFDVLHDFMVPEDPSRPRVISRQRVVGPADIIVMEDFTIRVPNVSSTALRVIGAAQYLSHVHGRPLVLQNPTLRLNGWRALGDRPEAARIVGQPHSSDALLHAGAYARSGLWLEAEGDG